ncbi:MFS transporter [Streptomyces malaysiensis subsp. malaysiensis]|uniref:MFS transporter n=1 Tax=Streptomyces malaysiensis TaxID=92644 RepID=UPI000BFCA637|nr:MFS transporter [Streptomyces malaysiensis]ATL88635.1 transporter, major facilitator family protein [Streptomyces malaysiensis]QDL68111.1 MFS transporter [Streptomyces malaysiensis]
MNVPTAREAQRHALRPDTSDGRRLVVIFAITQTLGYGCLTQGFSVLLIPISHDLHSSRTAVTVASTISTLIGAFAAYPVGRVLDRYGGRALMTAGSASGVLGVFLWSWSTGLPELYAAFVLIGLALAMSTYDAAFAVVVVATAKDHRDGAIVTITMITGFLTSFFYPLIGWLQGGLGWRTTLQVLAVAMMLIVIPAHLWAVPGRATHHSRITKRTGFRLGDAIRTARFWLLLVSLVAQAGTTSGFLVMMVTYFQNVGFSAHTASTLPLAVGVLQLTSRLALAPLSARFGMLPVTTFSFAAQALGLLLLPLADAAILPTVLCIMAFGLGYGISVVARPSVVAGTFGVTRFASIMAITAVPMAFARAGTPLVAAWLENWRFLILLGSVTAVAAVALVPLMRHQHRADG